VTSTIDPTSYSATLAELKARIRGARVAAQRKVNTELVELYWSIGITILDRQKTEGWGSKVIERLAQDLRGEFPEMRGFSRANLFRMRSSQMLGGLKAESSNYPLDDYLGATSPQHRRTSPERSSGKIQNSPSS
jgi:hypothetical protein